jgi:predicted transcriptional regulator
MHLQTSKEKIAKIVMAQPEDASYDEIIRKLAFARMVDSGLKDVRSGRVISNDEMASRIKTWQK